MRIGGIYAVPHCTADRNSFVLLWIKLTLLDDIEKELYCLIGCLALAKTVGHHLSDSTDYPMVLGLSELRGCAHAGIYDSCAYSTTATVLQQEERKH